MQMGFGLMEIAELVEGFNKVTPDGYSTHYLLGFQLASEMVRYGEDQQRFRYSSGILGLRLLDD